VTHPAELGVEQVDDQLRATVPLRRKWVPGRRDDRDPKRVRRRSHLLCPSPGPPRSYRSA